MTPALPRRFHISLPVAVLLAASAALALAQGPTFPSSRKPADYGGRSASATPQRESGNWLRVAQQTDQARPAPSEPTASNEPSQSSSPPPSSEEAARTEQQAAVLKLIASNREAAEKRHEELAKEKADWEEKLTKLSKSGLSEPRPYSYLTMDQARDELATETQNAKALRDAVTVAKEAVSHAGDEQADAERELLKAKDKLEHNEDAAAEPALAAAIADAEHAVAVATQTADLRRAELENLQLERDVQKLRVTHAEKRLQLFQQDVVFKQFMLDDVVADLDARNAAAAAAAKKLEDDLSKFLQPQFYKARQRLDEANVAQNKADVAALQAEVQAKELATQAADNEISILVNRQERLQELKTAWQRRYELFASAVSSTQATKWVDEARGALERLRTDAATLNDKIESVHKQLTAVEKKRQDDEESAATVRYWLDQSSKSLDQLRRTCERAVSDLEAMRQVHEKLLDDLTRGTLSDTAGRWLAKSWEDAKNVWDYPLTTIGDKAITVGKLGQGLFLFLAGVYASGMISRIFGRRFLTRMGVNASATAAMESVAFYVLVLLFTLFALKLVEVPLTAFTVLGGAVALGVGFGSQNIVNNFISGLILLAERPVKVGDLIQVADIYGNVEHIGARSTRVRTGDSLDIIVPNSSFLQTNVINWTLSDNHMRTHVNFGVMYGSPTGKVTQLALKAAANHDRVFDRPVPFVIFGNFGENALEFELHFWIAVRTWMERRTIESDIRFNIDHLFREAGIMMVYPQRDVHLIPNEPIQVKMLAADSKGGSDAA